MAGKKQPSKSNKAHKAPFSLFDYWARHVLDVVRSESKLVGVMVEHGPETGDAREAVIRGILDRIIPANYDIGTGEIIDSSGMHSKQMDIVISRRDFPSLKLPNGSRLYTIESVLATIEIKSELNSSTLIELDF